MTEQVDWRAKQPSQAACFSEDLKCWESWDTTCGHKAKDITPSIAWRRKSVKRGSARWSSLKGRERAIVNQTNIGTVSKATLWKLLRDEVERIIMDFFARIATILNWTELKYCMVKLDWITYGRICIGVFLNVVEITGSIKRQRVQHTYGIYTTEAKIMTWV